MSNLVHQRHCLACNAPVLAVKTTDGTQLFELPTKADMLTELLIGYEAKPLPKHVCPETFDNEGP